MVRHRSRSEKNREDAIKEQNPTIQAQVTDVRTTTTPGELKKVLCSVITRRSNRHIRDVPCAISDRKGHIAVPQENDWVKVDLSGRRGQGPVITGFVHTQDQQPPLCADGHWRHEFRRENGDPLYLEAEPADHSAGDPDIVRLGIKPHGVADPTTEVAVDDSGDSPTVRIQTDGDIKLSAGGDIVIDEGGTTTPVAKQNHTHDYTDTGDTSTGSGPTSTQTTTTPNEEGTDVEID